MGRQPASFNVRCVDVQPDSIVVEPQFFMTPRAGVFVLGHSHIGQIVKMHYYFENLLLYSWPPNRQSTSLYYVNMMKGLRSYHCFYTSVLSAQYLLVTDLIATKLRIGETSRGRTILSGFQVIWPKNKVIPRFKQSIKYRLILLCKSYQTRGRSCSFIVDI